MGGIAAWQAFSSAAEMPDAEEANGGNGNIDPPRRSDGADLVGADEVTYNTANNVENLRNDAQSYGPRRDGADGEPGVHSAPLA